MYLSKPFHLFRYIDEQASRYNKRKREDGEPMTDAERCDLAVRQIVGKRLTWNWLTGKEESASSLMAYGGNDRDAGSARTIYNHLERA